MRQAAAATSSSSFVSHVISCCLCANHHHHHHRWCLQLIFLLLGIGVLIPWNAFISAKAYFESRLCVVVPNNNDTSDEIVFSDNTRSSSRNVVSTFALVYNLSSVVMLTLVIAVESIRDRMRLGGHQHCMEQAPVTLTSVAGFSDYPVSASSSSTLTTAAENDTMNCSVYLRPNGRNEEPPFEASDATATDDTNVSSTNSGGSNSFWLVIVPLSLYLIVFVSQAIMTLAPRMRYVWAWTILGLIICGMSTGIAGAGIVASAGLLEASVGMNPYLMGQSLGGVAVSIANFIAATGEDPSDFAQFHCHSNAPRRFEVEVTAAAANSTSDSCIPYLLVHWSMFMYFASAALLIIACLLGFSCIDRVRDNHSNTDGDYQSIILPESDAVEEESVAVNDAWLNVARSELQNRRGLGNVSTAPAPLLNDVLCMDDNDGDSHRPTVYTGPLHNADTNADADAKAAYSSVEEITNSNRTDAVDDDAEQIWSKIRHPAVSIFFSFFVTLALFPGWTSDLRSVHQCRSTNRLANDLNVPFGFVLFSIGDFAGRFLAAQWALHKGGDRGCQLVMASGLRFLFFPLLYLCDGGSGAAHRVYTVDSDFYSYTVQFAFAVSNGCLLSTAFAYASSQIPDTPEMQERMSKVLSFAVAFGLLCGSLVSSPVVEWFGG